MVASMRPMPPATMPLSGSSPLNEATKDMPSNESMKNSGEPKESTSGRMTGMAAPRATPAKMAPTNELINTAPSARPVSPLRAMAWPSTIVDAVVGSPGTPNNTDVMSPVVAVTAVMPSKKANASTALILKTNGSIKRHRSRSAESGQDADDESDGDADHHEIEGRQVKALQKARDRACNMSMEKLNPPPNYRRMFDGHYQC